MERGALGQALLGIMACTKDAVVGKGQEPSISVGGTLLFSTDRLVAAIILPFGIQISFFHFFSVQGVILWGKCFLSFVRPTPLPRVRMLLLGASQSCGRGHHRLWFWKVESSFWNPP